MLTILFVFLSLAPPEWAKDAVWYQIFPERFHNADASNDPTRERIGGPEGWEITPWTSDWYARAVWEQKRGYDFRSFATTRRYGGDLQGVIDKLDYLNSLGVNVLYFNPVFDAISMHKYDASSYHHIDRHFGPDPVGDVAKMNVEDPIDPKTWVWTSADSLFLNLIRESHERGIRVVIDGVFNHTGRDFWAFRDLLEHKQNSRFKDWFEGVTFNDSLPDGFDYKGWWGYKALPELKEENGTLISPIRNHIFDITRRWMDPNGDGDPSDGVDGWRLDVAEDVGLPFWRDWHAHVRSINPNALTIAETWTDAAKTHIADDLFDVVMNYRFAYAAHDFFITRSRDARSLDRRLDTLRTQFPNEVNLSMQNLYDTHDTERLASMIVNKDRRYKQDSKVESIESLYDVRKPNAPEREIQKLMALFQYTYVGAPMVYYGTEAGLWGADDPDDRKPMLWPELTYDDEVNHPFSRRRPRDKVSFDSSLVSWYSQLGAIRAKHVSLRSGAYQTLLSEEGGTAFAYLRRSGHDLAIVLINNSPDEATLQIDITALPNLPVRFVDLLSGTTIRRAGTSLHVRMLPYQGMILVP
jgi:cyclomaltodextrinase